MISMGIIGAGRIAETMATTVRRMNETGDESVRLYGIASRDFNKAKEFAERHGIEKAFGSYEQMLRDPKPDLIYIATPHSHHFEHALLCLENGKHVLCEKAFTANADQAKNLIDIAEKKGLLITEAIWTRYEPSRKIIDDVIASNIVGEARMLTANLGYPIMHKERIVRPELAGGALLDVGVYALNFAVMAFGHPDEIHAVCQKSDTGVDINDSYTLVYKEKGRMAILCAGASAVSDRYGMIHCTKGFIQVENINNPQKVFVFDKKYELIKEIEVPPQLTGFEYEVAETVEAIESGKTECPSMPHKETVYMMEMMDDIRKKTGIVYPFEN
ncbi:Gfo/Idh/MocA family protein [Treponema parvum]|uniref:Gfo/Idh/MocA family protein n=1 Tax=Treponema parvum TaxID=138851 RepID=UPI001FEBB56C|nr:Gfo/Idh/MocA family oxidoreductase [Treponema parvum]